MLNTETLLKILINTYFFKARCLFLISDNLNIYQNNFTIPVVHLNNELLPEKIFRNYGCRDIIINYENSQEIFQKFEYLLRFQWERYNTKRYVIFWKNNTKKSIEEFFQLNEFEHVCDVLLITKQEISGDYRNIDNKRVLFHKTGNRNEIYQFFTHQFGGNNKPRKIQLLDKWFSKNSSFLLHSNLFPDKLTNLQGRNLVVATMNYRPYSVVDHDKCIFDGTEARLVYEFMKKYNLTPIFLQIRESNWGDVYPNGTGDGVLGKVAVGEADIGYAALYYWEKFYSYSDFSRNFIRAGMTVIAPAPLPEAGWAIPILSFSPETWMILALSFIICTFTVFLTLHCESSGNLTKKLDYSITILTRLYLLQSLNNIPGRKVFKYLFGMILLKVLIISSSYSSGLASVMTIPRYKHAILSVQDLADSNINWGGTDIAFLFAIKNVNYGPYKKIKTTFRVHSEIELAEISKFYNYAFLVERLPFGYFCIGEFIKREVINGYRIMRDDIYWDECIYMLRKHSVLLPQLDDFIFKIYEAGLEAHWESQVVAQHMDPVVQRVLRYYNRHRNVNNNAPVKLQWQHVQGPFGILFVGILLAVLCFFGELMVYRCKKT